MEVRQDFSHNSKPVELKDPIHFCSPCIFCIIALAIDLSENIVAIICSRKKSVWGFEEWGIDSLTERVNICKALEAAEDSPAGNQGPIKHN